MHNLKDIRKNIKLFEKKIKERNSNIDFKSLINYDQENRVLIQKKEKLEQEKKLLSKKKDPNNFKKSKYLTNQIEELENSQKKIQEKINIILSSIPNLALDDVPIGSDEKSNKIIKKSSEIKVKNQTHIMQIDKRNYETNNKQMNVYRKRRRNKVQYCTLLFFSLPARTCF